MKLLLLLPLLLGLMSPAIAHNSANNSCDPDTQEEVCESSTNCTCSDI